VTQTALPSALTIQPALGRPLEHRVADDPDGQIDGVILIELAWYGFNLSMLFVLAGLDRSLMIKEMCGFTWVANLYCNTARRRGNLPLVYLQHGPVYSPIKPALCLDTVIWPGPATRVGPPGSLPSPSLPRSAGGDGALYHSDEGDWRAGLSALPPSSWPDV
jgi:hypothetical protein